MSVVLITSIVIRLIALGWSFVLLLRHRHWHILFLTVMFGLMATRQTLTGISTAQATGDWSITKDGHLTELPGLVVSIMAFLAIFFLKDVLIQRSNKPIPPAEPEQINNRMAQSAILIGAITIVGAVTTGYLAYRSSGKMILRTVAQDNLTLARTIVNHVTDYLQREDNQEHQHIEAIRMFAKIWDQTEHPYPGTFLCIVNSEGRLTLHTRNPELKNKYVGNQALNLRPSANSRTVDDLLDSKESWSGRNKTWQNENQLVGYAYMEHLNALVGVHVPEKFIMHHLRASAMPWGIGLCIVAGLLIPVSTALLYNSLSSTQLNLMNANTQIRESARRLCLVTDSLPAMIAYVDSDLCYRFNNAAYERWFGLKKKELLGRHVLDVIGKAAYQSSLPHFEAALSGKTEAFDNEIPRLTDGQLRHIHVNLVPHINENGQADGFYVLVNDITDQKFVEMSLKESQRQFKLLAETSPSIVFQTDAEGHIIYVNKRFLEITGQHPNDSSGYGWAARLHPDDYERVFEGWLHAVEAKITWRDEYRFKHTDGSDVWVLGLASPIRSDNGDIAGYIGTATDITELKTIQHKLDRLLFSEREARAEADTAKQQTYKILERVTDAFVALDNDWCYTYVNDKAAKIFNRKREDLVGKHIWTEFPEGVGQPFYHAYQKASKSQTFVHLVEYYEPWGRWFENRIYPSADGLSIFFRDITEEKENEIEQRVLEDQLRQSQRMEAVGTLAGGIAHDLNNLLTVIVNHIEYVRTMLPKCDEATQSMKIVDQAVDQAVSMTNSLINYSSQLPTEKIPIDLALLIKESLRLLGRLLPASIRIIEDLSTDSGVWILGDRSQILQVLMNIVVNARDAMPDGGELHVKLGVKQKHQINKAVLTVQDTGSGMAQETVKHIFEPFFTAKESGKGTGLGLAIVHGIVKDHGGQIQVTSQQEQGTKFDISFKTCEAPPHQSGVTLTEKKRIDGHGELIVLAEDDQYVQQIMASTLENNGYQVETVDNGNDVMKAICYHGDKTRLVVLDLDLPKKSGSSCFEEIRSKYTDLPIIVVSGHVGRFLRKYPEVRKSILTKPFKMSVLVDMVGRTLNN